MQHFHGGEDWQAGTSAGAGPSNTVWEHEGLRMSTGTNDDLYNVAMASLQSHSVRFPSCHALLVDRDISLFTYPLGLLQSLVIHHGIYELPSSVAEGRRVMLDHILNGKCFIQRVSCSGCLSTQREGLGPRQSRVSLLQAVLTADICEDALREMSFALGHVVANSSMADECRAYISMCRDEVSSMPDNVQSIFEIERMTLDEVRGLCLSHGIAVEPRLSVDTLRSLLVRHLCYHGCGYGSAELCNRREGPDDNADCARILLLSELLRKRLRQGPLRLVLSELGITYQASASLNDLRRLLKAHIRDLRVGKTAETRRRRWQEARTTDAHTSARVLRDVERNWPQLVPQTLKDRIILNFREATSSDVLREYVCAVCAEAKPSLELWQSRVPVTDIDLTPIRCRYPGEEMNPFSGNEYLDGVMLDPKGVYAEHGEIPSIEICKVCYRSLVVRKQIPKLALANSMYIGAVPEELKDLTVVEEAMIARRRAKCWVVHLNENENGNQSTCQRGVKGHIIVYPTHPENLGKVLPPPIDEVMKPICVLFVGSNRPSIEWLRTKARPLIVRREKVRLALEWLQRHNPLYEDIIIDHKEIDNMPVEEIVPVSITVQEPTVALDAIGGRYDFTPSEAVVNRGNDEEDLEQGSIFEKVVVQDIEGRDVTAKQMAAAALKHLKNGGKYIEIGHDNQPCNEYEDENLFPLLYPTLFPYGKGGFQILARPVPVGMKAHAKHLFSLSDRRFQEHYSFLFTVFNMLQRRDVSWNAKLKVARPHFEHVAKKLISVSDKAIHAVSERLARGDSVTANSEEEKSVLDLMRQVSVVSSKVQGTSASRMAMRSEIRAMMMDVGLPSFYITINPADIYNPVVKLLAGSDIDLDNLLPEHVPNYKEQAILVAKNPFVAAKFFNIYMRAFLSTVLGFDVTKKSRNLEGGILGIVKGYYGCVEAQGRGTLHCHLVVWLEGALNPVEIKDRVLIQRDEDFKDRLLAFIDDTIQTEIPPDPGDDVVTQASNSHPCSVRGPALCTEGEEERQKDVHLLASRCQRHRHTSTCFKYCRSDSDEKECRFNLDSRHHVPKTTMDMTTGELNYKVIDGMVNSFCTTILEAVRCNMDIKFIGSGQTAKAILYYITDYISKAQLKSHVAYSVLAAAVKKMQVANDSDDSDTVKVKRLLVKCANALIAQQELSAPQVASFLMSYEDHFTSHTFRPLFWTSFESHIEPLTRSMEMNGADGINSDHGEGDDGEEWDDNMAEGVNEPATLEFQPDSVTIAVEADGRYVAKANQVMDYVYRGEALEDICVWDFVGRCEKMRSAAELKRIEKLRKRKGLAVNIDLVHEDGDLNGEQHSESEGMDEQEEQSAMEPRRGRRANARSGFKAGHPEKRTHLLRLRDEKRKAVPVPIGPGIPRRDKEEVRERYARLMLILFKPWRVARDLKGPDRTWHDEFELYKESMSETHRRVIENMQLLHECRDSRDDHFAKRRLRVPGLDVGRGDRERINVDEDNLQEYDEDDEQEVLDHLRDIERIQSEKLSAQAREILSALRAVEVSGLFSSGSLAKGKGDSYGDPYYQAFDEHAEIEWRKAYEERRRNWKRSLIATGRQSNGGADANTEIERGMDLAGIRIMDIDMAPDIQELNDISGVRVACEESFANMEVELSTVNIKDLVEEFSLNEEQALAFRIVAEHSLQANPEDPLRLFLTGAGGCGKSRVIEALSSWFKRLNQMRRFRLTSFTGVAARNIGGMTLHSALSLGTFKKNTNTSKTTADMISMWAGVDYLFIDEVSMVGSELLTDISEALSIAKQDTRTFGNISVIFAGDFAQLPPVGSTPLYSSQKQAERMVESSQRTRGQARARGRLLWMGVKHVITLIKQMRQSGAQNVIFRSLLQRLRDGRCTEDDYYVLSNRVLGNAEVDLGDERWKEAPIITRQNAVKDALNCSAAQAFARRRSETYTVYEARDYRHGKPVDDRELVEYLLSLHSGQTKQTLGRIPLVKGMPVLITHNYDVDGGVVNGSLGTVKSVRYDVDEFGRRHAKSCVVLVPDSKCENLPFLGSHEVVVLLESVEFSIRHPSSGRTITITRKQLPILPAFAMTDYKAQGKTLPSVIVDLESCRGSQSPYVMLSRATSLEGVLILRPFKRSRICCRVNEDLRAENRRLRYLDACTRLWHGPSHLANRALIDKMDAEDSAVG